MGPTWVLSAPDRPRVGPRNLVIRIIIYNLGISCKKHNTHIVEIMTKGLAMLYAHCESMWIWLVVICYQNTQSSHHLPIAVIDDIQTTLGMYKLADIPRKKINTYIKAFIQLAYHYQSFVRMNFISYLIYGIHWGQVTHIQYIPRNMHTVLLCFALLWLCNRL